MEELDADHKMYHYISGIIEVLDKVSKNGIQTNFDGDGYLLGGPTTEKTSFWDTYEIEQALYHAREIKEYLQTLLEIKIMFIEGIK